jgi:hypothetical protein
MFFSRVNVGPVRDPALVNVGCALGSNEAGDDLSEEARSESDTDVDFGLPRSVSKTSVWSKYSGLNYKNVIFKQKVVNVANYELHNSVYSGNISTTLMYRHNLKVPHNSDISFLIFNVRYEDFDVSMPKFAGLFPILHSIQTVLIFLYFRRYHHKKYHDSIRNAPISEVPWRHVGIIDDGELKPMKVN